MNGLVCATDVYIAVQTGFFALRGLTKLLELVDLVKRRLNPTLEMSGIIAGLFDARRNLNREVLEELRSFFGSRVFKTVIRENVRLAEAPSHGQSIFDYAPSPTARPIIYLSPRKSWARGPRVGAGERGSRGADRNAGDGRAGGRGGIRRLGGRVLGGPIRFGP